MSTPPPSGTDCKACDATCGTCEYDSNVEKCTTCAAGKNLYLRPDGTC